MVRPRDGIPLVGRQRELESLLDCLEAARQGQGSTVLIAGEAGIGKSRLVAEARTRAAGLGFQTLQGSCFEHDRSLPYAPLLDLLRTHFAGQPPEEAARALTRDAPEVLRLLPELATRLPQVVSAPASELEQEKRRLFHSVAQFFSGLAGPQPLLVVAEDLHWSDEISLELFLYQARRIVGKPILLLLTCRSDEEHPSLAHVVAALERERLAIELRPKPLTVPEVEAMLGTIVGRPRAVQAAFLHAVYTLTEGNPFFIEEVVRSLADTRGGSAAADDWECKEIDALAIPRTVQDAVQRRVQRLSGAARRGATLAAVVGRRFDFGLLRELLQCDELELLGWMKELIAAQLVVEESADRFAFRHALTREAIRAGLLARERRALHRAIGEAMERLGAAPDAQVEGLAYHFFEAEEWPKAFVYGRRAGERAQALYAQSSAVEHFTRALQAAGRQSVHPDPRLLRARGLAYESLGQFERARSDHEAVLGPASAAGDRRAEWQALTDLGLLWAQRDYAQTGGYYRRALEVARTLDDPALLARSLNCVGNWHVNLDQPREGRACHDEALKVLQGLDDQRGTAETLGFLTMANLLGGDLQQGRAYGERALALFRDLDDRQGVAYCLSALGLSAATYYTDSMVPAAAGLADAVRDGEQALAITRAIGWRSGEAFALFNLGFYLGSCGEYGAAVAAVELSRQIAEEIEHRQWLTGALCSLGGIELALLDYAAARTQLERALGLARESGSPHWTRCVSGHLASALVAQGELDRAEAVLDAALDPAAPAHTMGQRLCWCARAELALARGDAHLALEIAEGLIASAAPASGTAAIPRVSRLRGEALAGLRRMDEAEAALRAADAVAADQGARPLLWRTRLSLGRLLDAQAHRAEADAAFLAAAGLAADLAATIPGERSREGFLRRAAALLPRGHAPAARDGRARDAGGLTAREREVVALIAQGKSNPAIAETLVLGRRTVETHVSNVLTKLGLSSRAQLAVWAVANGLTPGREP